MGPSARFARLGRQQVLYARSKTKITMTTILVLKLVHLLGAAVLFGTGLGIAFFMYMAHRTGNGATIAATGRIVVIADALFTATAVVVQPVSGSLLSLVVGYRPWESWNVAPPAADVLGGRS